MQVLMQRTNSHQPVAFEVDEFENELRDIAKNQVDRASRSSPQLLKRALRQLIVSRIKCAYDQAGPHWLDIVNTRNPFRVPAVSKVLTKTVRGQLFLFQVTRATMEPMAISVKIPKSEPLVHITYHAPQFEGVAVDTNGQRIPGSSPEVLLSAFTDKMWRPAAAAQLAAMFHVAAADGKRAASSGCAAPQKRHRELTYNV